jgi:NAD-dependent deacetylase
MTASEKIAQARAWLDEVGSVAVLTGAGISAESGVPTFRGTGGLWRNFRAEELATPEAFARDPKLVWEWYDWRRGLVAETEPNPGHYALAELESRISDFTLITQNVDGLHDGAGSSRPLKLHGDIWELRCTRCGYHGVNREVPIPEIPPRCDCGALLRPDIVWFGEPLPVIEAAWRAAEQAELFLVAGTSALVQPAASLPLVAKKHGARLVEINLESTPLSRHVDLRLEGLSGEILPLLLL